MNLLFRRTAMFDAPAPIPAFVWEPAIERAMSLDPQAWRRAFGDDVLPAQAALPAIVELHARYSEPMTPISLSSAAVWLSDIQRKCGERAAGEIVQLALNADPPCSRACGATIVRMAYWSQRDFDAFVAGFMRMAADAGGIAI
ncbi:MAG: hypothetical protein IBJ15_00180 [Alphaproteobacteria bacterium]|nr:hypothetical protein [Alphaproteobacteria bacterium]